MQGSVYFILLELLIFVENSNKPLPDLLFSGSKALVDISGKEMEKFCKAINFARFLWKAAVALSQGDKSYEKAQKGTKSPDG